MELSEQEQVRRQSLQTMRDLGINPYPADEYVVTGYSTDIKAGFVDEGEGVWKIKEESDETTDNNLLKRASDSYDEIIVPITLQFIREYCDHLQLPYKYWSYVENAD